MGKDERLATESTDPIVGARQKTAEQLQNEVDALEQQVASLKAQIAVPFGMLELAQLRTIIAKQKTEAGDKDKRAMEDNLLDKLDRVLNPSLFDEPEEE